EGVEDRNILIYPNPCTTNFNLTTQNYEQIEIIRITNIYGQAIEFSASQLSPNHVAIYLNCANGIYFLEMELSGEKIIEKFIVNK
ncbi:MAG: T9SS type A sorting domain-containing protein, partial [Candidatus Kapaibacterium sp.]